MILLYTTPHDKSSIKARKWLQNQELSFQEVNLLKDKVKLRERFFEILPLLDEGIFELISTQSKYYPRLKHQLGKLSLPQLIDCLVSQPKLLKQPIIFDGKRLQIGFNPEEIRMFIPHHIRQAKLQLLSERILKQKSVE